MGFSTLAVDLVAKIASFEEAMSRATKSLDTVDKKTKSVQSSIKTAFAAAGVTLSVGGIALLAKSGIDAADALNDMSQRLGVSVKDLASFKLAAEQSGTSLDGVGNGIARLTRSIGDAEGGNKKLAEALQALGVTARDPKEAFFQLADAVQRIQDPSQRATLLNQVLGKSYQELVPLLNQGGDALRESAKQSETFAEAMERLAPDADKFNDQLELMKTNAAGAGAAILAELVPALNDVFERIGLVKNLIGAGGLFNTLVNTAGTSDISEVMRRVRSEIELTQQAIEGKRSRGLDSSAFEEKLRGLNAQLQVLIENRTKALLEPPQTETLRLIKADRAIGGGGTTDFSNVLAGKGKTIDVDSIVAADLADAWKRADDELKQYIDDREFMRMVDDSQAGAVNALEQDWIDAGRALKDEMMTPLEKFNVEMGRLDVLLEKGAIDFETYSRAVFDGFEQNSTKLKETDDVARELGLTFSSAFEDAVVGGKKFSDVLKGLVQDIARLALRKAVTEPLANSIGSFASSLFASANGNVFTNAPALSAYSGSVVSSPTVFPFANGIGLMGEAGAEAILPLKRGRDGKLGVGMDGGGGVVVNNYYNIDARGAQPGVGVEVRRAIDDAEERAVQRSVTQVQTMNQRGQLRLA